MREGRAVLGEAIVDVIRDPREAKAEARRRVLGIVVPSLAAAAPVAAAIGMVAIGHIGNRAEALRLADTVLEALESRIATEVAAWLGPAERAVRLMAELQARETLGRDAKHVRDFGAGLLKAVPQIAAVLYGDTTGGFVMARRGSPETIAVKTIETAPQRRVVDEVRDWAGRIPRVAEDPTDPYDPRTGPWFKGAPASAGISWTEISVFFTDRVPGLTVSLAVPERPDQPAVVLGADIRLDTLSRFLATLRIGKSGKAMILDRAGRLVAFPEADRTIRQEGDVLSPVRLDQLADPVLTRAFDTLRLEGTGRRTMVIEGKRHLSVSTPLDAEIGRDWVLMLVVPEEDLVGFVGRNSRTALAAGAAVGLLAVLLAVLLVRQGLKADARARDLQRGRGESLGPGQRARRARDRCRDRRPRSGARAAAHHRNDRAGGLGAPRGLLAVWRGAAEPCRRGCFRRRDGPPSAAPPRVGRVRRRGLPPSRRWLGRDRCLAAGSAVRPLRKRAACPRREPGTSFRFRSSSGRDPLAVLSIEDAAADRHSAIAFAKAAAAILARRLGEDGLGRTERRSETAPLPRPAGHDGETAERLRPGAAFLGRLAAVGVGPDQSDVELFSDLTVLVLLFTDPAALAVRCPDGAPLLADAVRTLRRVLDGHGIGYLRLSGDTVVAASGFDGNAVAAARRMMEAALALQEALTGLLIAADQPLALRIGVDTGPAIGAVVDEEGGGFNLWGEALEAATALAQSATEGMIQIGERTHALAADGFLARPRGRFWLEGRGETATYYLMARA
ncbi:MAG: adenylate/guanylate cyclase domain-containing protein [Acetobacteraceae bacterium]|nr:adenylate/guanylate cyclase domain-containing protein [Acetobacteraceae bacterium]